MAGVNTWSDENKLLRLTPPMRHDAVLLVKSTRYATSFDVEFRRIYPRYQSLKRCLPIADYWSLIGALLEDEFSVAEDCVIDERREIWLLRMDENQPPVPTPSPMSHHNSWKRNVGDYEERLMNHLQLCDDARWFMRMYNSNAA